MGSSTQRCACGSHQYASTLVGGDLVFCPPHPTYPTHCHHQSGRPDRRLETPRAPRVGRPGPGVICFPRPSWQPLPVAWSGP